MKLQRIQLAQFRQFREPVVIEGLAPGINLFAGPNEAGKSTLVAALRAAFFERHRSSSVDDLRPWGDGSATPEVTLDFRIGATDYHLSKRFLGKRRCSLQFGLQQLDGEAAEDHLAELLGFQYAGKGASAAKHWGIPGLLWIQQGTGQDIRDPVAHASDHLRTALNASLGQVASSGGDEVLAELTLQRNALLTPAGGAPRGVYADALKQRDQTLAELQALDAELAGYRAQVDELARLRQAHGADQAEQPWASLRQQAQAARERLAEIEQLQAALAAERQRAQQLDAQIALQRDQLGVWASQDSAAQARTAQLQVARQALQTAEAQAAQWATQVASAQTQADARRAQLQAARDRQSRQALQRERQQLQQQAAADALRLARAQAEHDRWLALQQQAAACAIDPAQLKALRVHDDALRALAIQQAAVATRLQFSLSSEARLRLAAPDGGPDDWLDGSGERLLLQAHTLHLGALGELRILPGGADLPALQREAQQQQQAQQALLQRLGVADLAEAEARHQAHAQLQAELKAAAATLKALAPQGLDALRAEAQRQAGRLQAIAADVARLQAKGGTEALDTAAGTAWLDNVADTTSSDTAVGTGLPDPGHEGPAADTELPAGPSVADAEADEERARHTLAQAQGSLGQARQAVAQAQAGLQGAERELAAAQALLATPGRAERLQTASQALVDARAEQAALAQALAARGVAVAQARPEILQQDISRFQASADTLARAHDDRAQALLRLELTLEAVGAQGLDERRASLASSLAQAERRAAELTRRAAALEHLLGLLQTRRGALTRQLQAPLQRHLDHYLQLLLPEGRLAIDERLSPGTLSRPGPHGPEAGALEALSFGAREQLGVISRLAYADLLQAAGRPTLILLDDALVHSDDERLARMKRVLFDAGTRHQILLFTCHPTRWRDLGVPVRGLSALRPLPDPSA